jgi:hypothetical protein
LIEAYREAWHVVREYLTTLDAGWEHVEIARR